MSVVHDGVTPERPSPRCVSVARIGIVGGGLMGRELAAAIGRWAALEDHPVTPRLEAICDTSPGVRAWFERIGSVGGSTDDTATCSTTPTSTSSTSRSRTTCTRSSTSTHRRRQGLPRREAVRIDLAAGRRIVDAIEAADVFVRCSSEVPYFPGALFAYDPIRSGALGRADRGRARASCTPATSTAPSRSTGSARPSSAARGVMNDLGMHVLHLPLRLGWRPRGCTPCSRTSCTSGPARTASSSLRHVGQRDDATPTPASRSRSPPSGSRRAR